MMTSLVKGILGWAAEHDPIYQMVMDSEATRLSREKALEIAVAMYIRRTAQLRIELADAREDNASRERKAMKELCRIIEEAKEQSAAEATAVVEGK